MSSIVRIVSRSMVCVTLLLGGCISNDTSYYGPLVEIFDNKIVFSSPHKQKYSMENCTDEDGFCLKSSDLSIIFPHDCSVFLENSNWEHRGLKTDRISETDVSLFPDTDIVVEKFISYIVNGNSKFVLEARFIEGSGYLESIIVVPPSYGEKILEPGGLSSFLNEGGRRDKYFLSWENFSSGSATCA